MEYYKELFFTKKKHSYDLHNINFHIENEEDVVKYNNYPSKGFKLVQGNLLDPVTGYIFHPENSWYFKDLMIRRNVLNNGVCVEPIIFEYIKDGTFNAHLYNDVKDDLVEVSVEDKISLSESKSGTLLRSINDESYYIYMGMVGQYYVSENGKGNVKKKHLVLKTDFFKENDDDDDTVLNVHHFSYIDFTKDKEKKYFKVKDISPENLKIKYYSYTTDVIPVGDYIADNVFDVYGFQHDYPSLLLSSTVRILFSKEDISMTRNKVKLEYDYIGEMEMDLNFHIDYSSFDNQKRMLYGVNVVPEIKSTTHYSVDFSKHNYVVELDDEFYLVAPRRLVEFDCVDSYFKTDINLFRGYTFSTEILLYKMGMNSIISVPRSFYRYYNNNNDNKSFDWSKSVKLYRVEYVLNDTHRFNIFSRSFNRITNASELNVIDPDVFEIIKENKGIAVSLFGEK